MGKFTIAVLLMFALTMALWGSPGDHGPHADGRRTGALSEPGLQGTLEFAKACLRENQPEAASPTRPCESVRSCQLARSILSINSSSAGPRQETAPSKAAPHMRYLCRIDGYPTLCSYHGRTLKVLI